ncbi:MAG: hypothetical protein JHD22_04910, partial [Ilumatobacteraceae bacterium]|nr:hypothetical protein [Ilumatobacteraceae bacterium]
IGITTLGYFLGEVSWIESNIEVALILIVLISVLPMLIEILRHRRANRK